MNRKQIRGAAAVLVLMMLAAGCGGKTEKPAETSAAAEQTAETTAEGQSAESTPAGETSAEETTAEETTEPVPLVVTKHKEDGTHMVTAGALTISVPTTFEGLEMEGAEFQGDQDLVRSGKTGTARVKYKEAYGSRSRTIPNMIWRCGSVPSSASRWEVQSRIRN